MGLFGFQIRPKIVDFGGLNGLKPGQDPLEVAGRFVPHHFKWILARFGAA